MFKRTASLFAAIALLALAFYSPPAHAQSISGVTSYKTEFRFERAYMRNTTAAAAVARNPFWNASLSLAGANGFTDSLVFRRGATTRTVYDTTIAYPVNKFNLPPNYGSTLSNALVDTSSVPWLIVRVHQDSTTTGPVQFTGTSSLDSVRVAAEYSLDGSNWFSCSGTPTYRFDTVFMTSGQDGLQSPTVIGVEGSPGEDGCFVVLKCHPSQAISNAFIVNRTLCAVGGWVRFIVGGAYTGQYAVELGSWKETE